LETPISKNLICSKFIRTFVTMKKCPALRLDELEIRANEMRICPTYAEGVVYDLLRENNIIFQSQVVFGYYILDFVIPSKLLIIELDGVSHKKNNLHDKNRDNFCKDFGLTTLRVPNKDATKIMDYINVIATEFTSTNYEHILTNVHNSRILEDKNRMVITRREGLKLENKRKAIELMDSLPSGLSGKEIAKAIKKLNLPKYNL
jgi:very-short-patch-repair endonuclease